jgi:hypothetical protein
LVDYSFGGIYLLQGILVLSCCCEIENRSFLNQNEIFTKVSDCYFISVLFETLPVGVRKDLPPVVKIV